MSERFYTNCPLAPGLVELDGPEAHHLAIVSRLRAGSTVSLFNGDGAEYPATIVSAAKRLVVLEVTERLETNRELTFSLETAAPLPKGDRAQFMIEKLTEIGVTSFVPLVCERSVVHPGEGKIEKLERYVIEASKQCRRNVLMRISPAISWKDYVLLRDNETRFLGHPNGSVGGMGGFGGMSVRIAIGPEGGFTVNEVNMANDHTWQLISMGPRILRIETAALVMASAVTCLRH